MKYRYRVTAYYKVGSSSQAANFNFETFHQAMRKVEAERARAHCYRVEYYMQIAAWVKSNGYEEGK